MLYKWYPKALNGRHTMACGTNYHYIRNQHKVVAREFLVTVFFVVCGWLNRWMKLLPQNIRSRGRGVVAVVVDVGVAIGRSSRSNKCDRSSFLSSCFSISFFLSRIYRAIGRYPHMLKQSKKKKRMTNANYTYRSYSRLGRPHATLAAEPRAQRKVPLRGSKNHKHHECKQIVEC